MNRLLLVVVYFSISLLGCSDYPGAKSNAGLKLALEPTWGGGKQIANGGICHIDSINDKPGETTMIYEIDRDMGLRVSGWSALSVEDGVVAEDVNLSLRLAEDIHGLRYFVKADKVSRQDVVEYFKNPKLVDTGFKVLIDIKNLRPGKYIIEVIQSKEGIENILCPVIGAFFINS